MIYRMQQSTDQDTQAIRSIITLTVSTKLSENGFSLDELVFKTKELFERRGIAGFVALLLELVDARIAAGLNQDQAWHPRPCCAQPNYELRDRAPRRFRTSIGTIRITWRRVRCRNCGRTLIPLREFLGLVRYQSKSAELEKVLTEIISEQNYRRTTRHLDVIGMIPVPRSTAHRWVTLSACDELQPPSARLDCLMADGTGYKRRPDPLAGKDNKGELRVALGVTRGGTVVPLGAYSGDSWETIGQALQTHYDRPGRLADVLVSDGEPGLAEGLAPLIEEAQRCQWHGVHDLDRQLWLNDAPREERRRLQHELAGIIDIQLPAEDFERVAEDDRVGIKQTTDAAETKLDELVQELIRKGYRSAASYVANAKDRLFTYVRRWLRCGIVSPRVSSLIERLMRELGRRLKRIAFGWSEAGAAKMARIIIKRVTSAGQWEAYWRDRLRITDNVSLKYEGVKAT